MVVELAAYGVGFVVVGAAIWMCNKLSSKKRSGGRRMSFNSHSLINGSFPETMKVPPPVINTSLFFTKCPSEEGVVKCCENFLAYERCRSKTKKVGGEWFFVETEVNMKDHVQTCEVRSEEELKAKIDEICMQDLDGYGDRPLWMFHRIINTGKGVSAVVSRVHHVIGDGISLVESMKNMFLDDEGKPVNVSLPERVRGNANKTSALSKFWSLFKSVIEVATLANTPYDTQSSFTHQNRKNLVCSEEHQTVFFPTLRLDFVKELKNKAGVTINDLIMTAVGGSIRRYCEHRGDQAFIGAEAVDRQSKKSAKGGKAAKITTRCLLPVAFPRTPEELSNPAKALRNKWAFVSAELPVGVPGTAKDRLIACNALTNNLKKSPSALVQLWIQDNLLSSAPLGFLRHTASEIFSRHSLVLSNVPGPNCPVYFAGERLLGVQFIFPNAVPQCSVISYNGSVFGNINIDTSVIAEPQLLSDYFGEEMLDIAQAYGMDCSKELVFSPVSPGGVFGMTPQ